MPANKFYSNGKLLLTAEYVVLDGALALVLPTRFGQSLKVEETGGNTIDWTSLDHKGEIWFHGVFKAENGKINCLKIGQGEKGIAQNLQKILQAAYNLDPSALKNEGFFITTHLDFPNNWGLGSSSTLINNIAKWLKIDAYLFLKNTFGGSGFDIAAAQHAEPVLYELHEGEKSVLNANFNPDFKENLFFVHLNQKQNTRISIEHYRAQPKDVLENSIQKISGITGSMLTCETLAEFKLLMEIHENIISGLVNLPKVKSRLFPDFSGQIKSLGGWGGDFILATGREKEKNYFKNKGYPTIVPYKDMIL